MSHHWLRKRDRPLRTYSRKTASQVEPRGEPAAKKAKLAPESDIGDVFEETTATSGSDFAGPGSSSSPAEAVPRSSILKYFQPVMSKQQAEPSQNEEEKESQDVASEHARTRKGPRLLKIRTPSSLRADYSDNVENVSGRDAAAKDLSPRKRKRKTLQEGGDQLLNRRNNNESAKSGRRQKAIPSPTVQTTLNISSQAAFAECKLCDIVWNPLYPDDVKYHEKRHKSAVRRKKKEMMDRL